MKMEWYHQKSTGRRYSGDFTITPMSQISDNAKGYLLTGPHGSTKHRTVTAAKAAANKGA